MVVKKSSVAADSSTDKLNDEKKLKKDIYPVCLLYTSDAADDLLCVDLGGRRIIKKKKNS